MADGLLPPFPVDDTTLDMLSAAIDPRSAGDEQADRSCVGDFLTLASELGGSDPAAVDEESDEFRVLRDPQYSTHDVMTALIAEVRRLRLERVDAEQVVEHAIEMSDGSMAVRTVDPGLERIRPLGKWIENKQHSEGLVYRRVVRVVDDWKEVPRG